MYKARNDPFAGPSHGWSQKNTPVYRRPRKDLLLVGVTHYDPQCKPTPDKAREFRKRVGKTEHLILEGTEDAQRYMAGMGKSYEAAAFTERKGTRHFLDDDDTDHVMLLHKHGITPDTFGTFFMLPAISKSFGDLDGVSARVRKYFVSAEAGYGPAYGLYHVDMEKMVRASRLLLAEFACSLCGRDDVDSAYYAFQSFMARVRDAEIYRPRITRICDALPGTKAAVVGVSHVGPLTHLLKGGKLELDWNAYVESLDGFAKGCVERIGRFVRKDLAGFSGNRTF